MQVYFKLYLRCTGDAIFSKLYEVNLFFGVVIFGFFYTMQNGNNSGVNFLCSINNLMKNKNKLIEIRFIYIYLYIYICRLNIGVHK